MRHDGRGPCAVKAHRRLAVRACFAVLNCAEFAILRMNVVRRWEYGVRITDDFAARFRDLVRGCYAGNSLELRVCV
jgi:hypothetical protein